MSGLKPCPFCGGEPTSRSRTSGENEGYETTFIIRCECGSQFLAKDDLNKLGWVDAKGKAAKCKAVEGWNTRDVPDVQELVRYDLACDFNGKYYPDIIEVELGEYVRYNQAAAIIAAKDNEIERLREALKPFAMYMKNNGDGRIDLNNKNDPLPDTDAVGWVYLTYKDFRMAEGALGEGNA